MKIKFLKSYLKAYKKIPRKMQLQAEERIVLFGQNRNHPLLRDHQLSGTMADFRAFSVSGDYRIIYKEEDGDCIFVFVLCTRQFSLRPEKE